MTFETKIPFEREFGEFVQTTKRKDLNIFQLFEVQLVTSTLTAYLTHTQP